MPCVFAIAAGCGGLNSCDELRNDAALQSAVEPIKIQVSLSRAALD